MKSKENKSEVIASRYQKVAVGIAQRIVEGKYVVGEKLKSRSTIASNFNVSPETARKAINVLVDLDIMAVKQGSGAVVLSQKKAADFLEQFEASASAKELQKEIRDNIARQKREIEDLTGLVNTLISQTDTVHKKFPLDPFALKLVGASSNIGKNLSELNLWHQTGATVIAIEHEGQLLLSPGPYAVIEENDTLYFIGDELTLPRMKNLFAVEE